MKDYYNILGINSNAPDEIIKAAYKALAKKYHPDIYNGDKSFAEQKMKEINEAYEILSDVSKRKDYDSRSNHTQTYSSYDEENSNSNSENSTSDDIVSSDLNDITYEELSGAQKIAANVLAVIIVIGVIAAIIFACVHLWAMIKGFLFPENSEKTVSSSNTFSKAQYEKGTPENTAVSLVDAVLDAKEADYFDETCIQELCDISSNLEYPDIFLYIVNDEKFFMDAIHSSIEYSVENVEYTDENTAVVSLNYKTISFYELGLKAQESADKDAEKLSALNKNVNYFSLFDKYEKQFYPEMDKSVEAMLVFTMKKESDNWMVTECSDPESFINILSGNT